MELAERRSLRRLTLCALYFAQGVPWGFTTITIPAYLGARGVGANAIGIALAMTALPLSFKWVWGPLIDSVTLGRRGRRRPWIVIAQLMMAATIASMALAGDIARDLSLLGVMLLVHTAFSALQDVAVDALAIDLLEPDERGRANGVMNASRYVGGILGGAGMSWLAARTSLHTALFTQALILLATTLIPLTIVEKDPPEPRPRIGDVARSLATVFSLRSTAVTAFLMLVLMVPIGFLSANELVLFTQHVGWDPDRYGQLTGGLGLVASLVGSIAGGELADRIGVRRALAVVSLVLASAWCAFGLAKGSWQSVPFTTTFVLVEQACIAALLVSIFALCMNVSWSRIAATQFAAYMALSNFSGALGFRLSGVASTWFAVDRIYVIAAVVQVALTAIVVTIDPGETARALPLPPGARTPARGIAVVVGFAVVLAALTGFVVHGAL